ncbi:CBS domain-containing protein [Catenovulum sp. SM1970]|uniref:DUF294 nucleotidyltransferase-like domain-containing protein n=1 Tax=Marinifaba aquimaris TaxID=2741323 RepID=UPI001572A562|nr:DUF294 nucleotidyltransferase-like domain-containing protein [Marinifaba aquimaris]NTS76942.1 CBS domain-containing protein [Marinifaba aquimaris]
MSAINRDVLQFLAASAPFHLLPERLLNFTARHLKITYLSQQNQKHLMSELDHGLCLVRKGVFDFYNEQGLFLDRLEQGDCFGYSRLLTGQAEQETLKVVQDGLIYFLPAADFEYLRHESSDFEHFFIAAVSHDALTVYKRSENEDSSLASVLSVANPNLITISQHESVLQACQKMSQAGVSSLLVTNQNQALIGIITDRDLRNRVLAKGLDSQVLVNEVMTREPLTLEAEARVFDAIQLMTQHNIHHLPIVKADKAVAMLTNTDLARLQRSEPIFFTQQLNQAKDLNALSELARSIPEYVFKLKAQMGDVTLVSHLLATFYDAICKRLIDIFQQDNGEAPVAFAWLLFGSQAREEQTLSSDQDNGLLIDDVATEQDKGYFLAMADFVCNGLAQCGLVLCPGNVMASNSDYCLTLSQWTAQFNRWTKTPTPESVLASNIFFDNRLAFGDSHLYQELLGDIRAYATDGLFLAQMAKNTVNIALPLGLFNQFQFERQGLSYINIKKQGLAIVNDIARIYALKAHLSVSSTYQRLSALASDQSNLLSAEDAKSLMSAWQLFMGLRLMSDPRLDEVPKNCICPHSLDALTQQQLKWAFKVIRNAQEAIALKFSRGVM